MTEEQHRLWDTVIKVITVVLTAAGLVWGYLHAIEEFAQSNRKPFLEMKMKYNLELVEVVSRIARPSSPLDQDEAIHRFWQLYAGASAMVEDGPLEDAVNTASVCIQKLEKHGCEKFELEGLSLILASEVRNSLFRAWRIESPARSSAPQPAGAKTTKAP